MTIDIDWRESPEGEVVPEGVKALVQAYWARTPEDLAFTYTQKALTQRFGVTSPTLTQLVKQWGWGMVDGLFCQDCGSVASAPNRTTYQQLQQKALQTYDFRCDECEAERAEERREAEKLSDERRRQHLQEHWNGWKREGGPRTADEISLRHAVLLLALNRSMANETMRYFDPADEAEVPLAPQSLIFSILDELWRAGLIGAHPGTPLSHFRWEGEEAKAVFTTCAHLVLPMMQPDESFAPMMARLTGRLNTRDFTDDWDAVITELQRELWTAEILAYLQLQLKKHRMGEFSPGEKTHFVIGKMLAHFSLGQCWGIVHRSVTRAAAALATGMPRRQAVNSTITRMDGFVDRAMAEDWSIKPYGRDFDLPASALASVLWETVLRRPLQDAVRDAVLDLANSSESSQIEGTA